MLDPDYIVRAAPPGSLRYFSLLYSPAELRETLAALYVIDNEIRVSAAAIHDVAHTRLQWWRGEIDRLINRNAQHPATKVLQSTLPNASFSLLHELLVAADLDLVRMTFNTTTELNAYFDRSGGALFELVADERDRKAMRQMGALIRRIETLRDIALHARHGNIYWPLDELEHQQILPSQFQVLDNQVKLRPLFVAEANRTAKTLQSISISSNTALARPIAVLKQLFARLAERLGANGELIFTQRLELGPWQKVWTAWRAARRHSH